MISLRGDKCVRTAPARSIRRRSDRRLSLPRRPVHHDPDRRINGRSGESDGQTRTRDRSPFQERARPSRQQSLELKEIIEEWLATFPTRDDAMAALDKERVPCAPVLTVNEAVEHPHLNERKTVR